MPSGWRVGRHAPISVRLRAGERIEHVHITGTADAADVRIEHGERRSLRASLDGNRLTVTLDGLRRDYICGGSRQHDLDRRRRRAVVLEEVREASVRADEEHSGDAELVSPMPGAIVAVSVDDGAEVKAGTVVVTVEAMKMEHALTAPVDGVVELLVAVGDQVKVGQTLARIAAKTDNSLQTKDDAHD